MSEKISHAKLSAVPTISAMAPYQLANLDSDAISLAQNESAYPVSPAALDEAHKAMTESPLYPDPDWTDLRQAIADTHGLDPQQLICGTGSMDLIGALLHTYVSAGDDVVASQYGYLFVKTVCQQIGARYVQAAEIEYTVSVDNLLEQVTDATRALFVCNPGNPTGTRVSSTDIVRLRDELPEDCLLIVDQAYAEFDDQDHQSVFDLVHRNNTVVTRTFSKAYCMAGLRVGWACAADSIISEVRKWMNPNNLSQVAQRMAIAAVRDQVYLQDVVSRTAAAREKLRQTLKSVGLPTPVSHTNFALVPAATKEEAVFLDTVLRKSGFVARNMAGYDLSHCLRITVGSDEHMQQVGDLLVRAYG